MKTRTGTWSIEYAGKEWLVECSYTVSRTLYGADVDGNRGVWRDEVEVDSFKASDPDGNSPGKETLSALEELVHTKIGEDELDWADQGY